MSALNSNNIKIDRFFTKLTGYVRDIAPNVIAETATEYFKESFRKKSFDGVQWEQTKKAVKRGSLMVRSGLLLNSIRPSIVTAGRVVISAGNSRVPYAKVHNEGEQINRSARSETFVRNRFKRGVKKGMFKRGTTDGAGFSFKAYSYNMPARPYMGITNELKLRIINRIKNSFLK